MTAPELVHIACPSAKDGLEWAARTDLCRSCSRVDLTGHLHPDVTPFAGLAVKPRDPKQDPPADPVIVRYLRTRAISTRTAAIPHQFPHCWRCDTPLIYYALSTWFIAMSRERRSAAAHE